MQIQNRFVAFLLVYCALGFQTLMSQNPYANLLLLSKAETNPKNKCDTYIHYLEMLGNLYHDSVVQLVIESEKQYQNVGFVYGLGRCKSLHAWLCLNKEEYDSSLKLGHEALI